MQERLRSLYSLAGQRLALLGEHADDAGLELTTVSQAHDRRVRAEIDEIAAGLGDAQDAAADASAAT